MKRYAIIILLVIVAAFGGLLAFCESHDNRTADSLSAYCRIDFQGLRGSDGTATSARFTLWDTRYDGEKPSTHLKLYTDDKSWELTAAVKQEPSGLWQKTNEISVFLPAAALPAIAAAKTVRCEFSYPSGKTIDLPLNDADLAYWQAQVE